MFVVCCVLFCVVGRFGAQQIWEQNNHHQDTRARKGPALGKDERKKRDRTGRIRRESHSVYVKAMIRIHVYKGNRDVGQNPGDY